MRKKWKKIIARNVYPLHMSAQTHESFKGFNIDGISWKVADSLFVNNNSKLSHYFVPAKKRRFISNIEHYLEKGDNSLIELLGQMEKEVEDTIKILPQNNFKQIKKLIKQFNHCSVIMMFAYDLSHVASNEFIIPRFKNELDNEINDYINSPCKKTSLIKEYEKIQQVSREYQDNKNIQLLENSAKILANEFGYIHSEYRSQEWKESDYIDAVKNIDTKNKDYDLSTDKKIKKLDQHLQWLIEVNRRAVYLFDEAKVSLVRANWALRKNLKDLGLNENELLLLNWEEFKEWITTKELPDKKILDKRKKYYATIIKNDKIIEYHTKKDINKLIDIEEIDEFTAPKNIERITGQVAFPGKVKGRVRLVFSQNDANNLRKGEVLVASMTTPELVSGMQKAIAFVTDEGGTLCHAAIISREMKTPCIVGTDKATQILKDGDLVEVDADEGIVKILENSKQING